MNWSAIFFGNLVGKILHFFMGCKPFIKYIKNSRGKFKERYCQRCKKYQERRHGGRWITTGRYKRKKK